MSLKNALRKAASLLVELPPEPEVTAESLLAATSISETARSPQRTVEQVVAAAPGPNLDQIKVPDEVAKTPPVNPDGSPNFAVIYEQAGVPPVLFGADEALGVIKTLPADLPIDIKRRTVGATLTAMGKAMGVSTDSVVADASRKLAALASFDEQLKGQTAQYVTAATVQIDQLKAQISDYEQRIASAQEKLAKAGELIDAEADRVDDVLEFFTLDVSPSRNAEQ
jgi:hypothetical protein